MTTNGAFDWDGTMTIPPSDQMDNSIAEVLKDKAGRELLVTLVTGRFPGQIQVLGNKDLETIMSRNSQLNHSNIHVYAGGSTVSDSDGNIYEHARHRLEDDQIEAIATIAATLRQQGAEPFLAFQSAINSTKTPTGWTNGPTNMIYTNSDHVTQIRDKMYAQKVEMPKDAGEIAALLAQGKPSKVILVTPSLAKAELTFDHIVDAMGLSGLGVTGHGDMGIDIAPRDLHKISGIILALELLGIPELDFYAGDSFGLHGNDRVVLAHETVAKSGIVVVHDGKVPDMSFARIPYTVVDGSSGLAQHIGEITSES